ncbi:MAG: DNA polymerase III subunit delta [Holdemanella sp.]|nr:DNA polymerase III subunit delta [Holdemanella sp.]
MNIIVHGSDTSRVKKRIGLLKKKYDIQLPTIDFDAEHIDQREILVEMDSFSIFDERKMIVIENCTFLCAKDTTKYKVEEFIERSNQDDMCIVVYTVYNDKLDKRKNVVKEMLAKSELITCIALDEKSKPAFVDDICKRLDLRMDYQAREYFLNVTGLDSSRIEMELEKLKTYASFIDEESARALITIEPEDNIFKMTDALFGRNALLFLSYYRNFREQNMAPVAINALIASQVRFLFNVRYLMDAGYGKEEITSKLKTTSGRIYYTMKKADAFSCEELLDILEELANLDQNMKTGKMDMDEGFERFAFDMLKENI